MFAVRVGLQKFNIEHKFEIASIITLYAKRLRDVVLVGHNVGFDLDFLQEGINRAGLPDKLSYHKIDTVTLAFEHLVPCGLTSLSLDRIRKFLGWDMTDAHSALKDTEDARRLYYLLVRAPWWRRLLWRLQAP